MKKEFIILGLIVLVAIWFTFGCSIRLHCTKGMGGNTEKYTSGTNAQEMCFNGCYKMFEQDKQDLASFHQCGMMCAKGCSASTGWPSQEDCMTDCAFRHEKSMAQAMARCQGKPDSCLLNSPEWKSRSQCYTSCVKQ